MSLFTNKTVIVTGSGQGIGRAVSRRFAFEGASVIIAENDEEAGLENETYIRKQGFEATFVKTDVSDAASVEAMAAFANKKYGGIHVLVNNAVLAGFGNIFETSVEEWDRAIAVNLSGVYYCVKFCAPYMKAQKCGSIINMASTRAFMSEPDTEAYSASKGGIVALTHSLAISLGSCGIRVNSISPGWIDVSSWKKSSVARQEVLSREDHSQHPVGRVGVPDDIAEVCLFLASDKSGFITGENITVDGGMTKKMIYV
ncbi:MAG TPA: glucose 1-dehydrogenase [Ruminiclostridium sp.]|nr:glucose 1-dehydrogenase [Ruminiclostridium sp.]